MESDGYTLNEVDASKIIRIASQLMKTHIFCQNQLMVCRA